MSILDDLTVLRPKEEFLRLVSVALDVPTDEQIEKTAATLRAKGNTNTIAPRASLRITWEPLSYNMRGVNGNLVTDYIDVSFGLDPEHLANIRANGWLGIPDNKLVRVDEKLDARGQTREWPRYRLQTKDILPLDIDVDGSITGKVGQPYSTAVGHVFRCSEGSDTFARNVQDSVTKQWKVDTTNPRRSYMRYPLEMDDSYVAPADVPVRIPRSASTEAGAVFTATVAAGLTSDSLRAAVLASGLVGKNATELSGANRQISFVASHMEDSEETLVFGTAEVNEAANEGELIDFLVKKGAVTVDDSGVLV